MGKIYNMYTLLGVFIFINIIAKFGERGIVPLIIFTTLFSFLAWQREELFKKFYFRGEEILKNKEYYRSLTYGLLHADINHLFLNMFSLYSFGNLAVGLFNYKFNSFIIFPIYYLLALALSPLTEYSKQNRPSVGASGAVLSVVGTVSAWEPSSKISILFIPVGIPAPLFLVIFIGVSYHLHRRGNSNIGHMTHIIGIIIGVLFGLVTR